jgi:tetratricopeptide (TPR) repeat protein
MTEPANQPRCDSCSDAAPHPIFELCTAKRFEEALQLCRDEVVESPGEAEGYRHTADVLELAQRHGEALPYRNRVLELAPGSAANYFSRGDLFYQTGNHAAAIEDFSRAAELDSDGALGSLIYLYRADCHSALESI